MRSLGHLRPRPHSAPRTLCSVSVRVRTKAQALFQKTVVLVAPLLAAHVRAAKPLLRGGPVARLRVRASHPSQAGIVSSTSSLLCSSTPPSCCHPQCIVTALLHSGTWQLCRHGLLLRVAPRAPTAKPCMHVWDMRGCKPSPRDCSRCMQGAPGRHLTRAHLCTHFQNRVVHALPTVQAAELCIRLAAQCEVREVWQAFHRGAQQRLVGWLAVYLGDSSGVD